MTLRAPVSRRHTSRSPLRTLPTPALLLGSSRTLSSFWLSLGLTPSLAASRSPKNQIGALWRRGKGADAASRKSEGLTGHGESSLTARRALPLRSLGEQDSKELFAPGFSSRNNGQNEKGFRREPKAADRRPSTFPLLEGEGKRGFDSWLTGGYGRDPGSHVWARGEGLSPRPM